MRSITIYPFRVGYQTQGWQWWWRDDDDDNNNDNDTMTTTWTTTKTVMRLRMTKRLRGDDSNDNKDDYDEMTTTITSMINMMTTTDWNIHLGGADSTIQWVIFTQLVGCCVILPPNCPPPIVVVDRHGHCPHPHPPRNIYVRKISIVGSGVIVIVIVVVS